MLILSDFHRKMLKIALFFHTTIYHSKTLVARSEPSSIAFVSNFIEKSVENCNLQFERNNTKTNISQTDRQTSLGGSISSSSGCYAHKLNISTKGLTYRNFKNISICINRNVRYNMERYQQQVLSFFYFCILQCNGRRNKKLSSYICLQKIKFFSLWAEA